jgi:hypothetical protein
VTDDLATEEGLLRAWNHVMGDTCHAVSGCLCVARPEELPGVVVVGTFAYDLGCRDGGVFADGAWYPQVHAATGPMLRAQGWAAADPARRQALALEVTDRVLLAWDGRLVRHETKDGTSGVTAAVATSMPDGGVRVEGHHPVYGRRPHTKPTGPTSPTYNPVVYVFGPDGNLQPLPSAQP